MAIGLLELNTSPDYDYQFHLIQPGNTAFQGFNANCVAHGGVELQIEERWLRGLTKIVSTSSKSCTNLASPNSSCYQTIEISSHTKILNGFVYEDHGKNQPILSNYWHTPGGDGRSVLFCFTDSDNPPGIYGDAATYKTRAAFGLDSWQIGLNTQTYASTRQMNSGGYIPANWITVTDDLCNATGVPADLQGSSNCPFYQTNVIGICQIRVWGGTASIADTTLVIRKSYQDNMAVSETRKKAVFSHEIGHCLGLRHTNNIDYVMYPFITDTPSPHADELSAIHEAYPTPTEPSATTRDNFYFTQVVGSSTLAIRQYSFPVFVQDTYMGTALSTVSSNTGSAARGSANAVNAGMTVFIHEYRDPDLK